MSYTHLGDAHPVARKEHNCYLCNRPIVRGERYVRRSSVDGDGFGSTCMHVFCESRTRSWTIDEWECHDPVEFRTYEIGGA